MKKELKKSHSNPIFLLGACLALKWFRSYLTNRKQFVESAHRNKHSNEIKNYLSSEQYIKYGVHRDTFLDQYYF